MDSWDRERAVDRVEELVETVEAEQMPVPVREIWVYGDVALGLDPVERLDVYLTKDILLHDDADREAEFRGEYGVKSVGKTVRAEWAEQYPEHLQATSGGHAAPEQCLAAHLLGEEPIHLEVCNASFEDNVRQRLEGALARESYEEILDPRGVCLWMEGTRSTEAFEKLRAGEFVFPTLPDALEMLGAEAETAQVAADALTESREQQAGSSVRGDVI
ncbi:MAG: hypothetical protein ACI8TL_001003 [Natronomonas sp.]|jgi:hypothetical protein